MNELFFTKPVGTPALAHSGDARMIVSGWRGWSDESALLRGEELAGRLSTPNPFYESWFLRPALAQFDPKGQVMLARMERAGRLDALVPLIRTMHYGRRPIPHLATWLHANCFLGAPLVSAGAEPAFWRALFAWADRHAGAALFLHLAAMPLEGALADALRAVGVEQGRRVALVHREERAMLASPLDADAYLVQALNGKKRKELRRQHTRLAEQGVLTVVRRDDEAGLASWIERFLALEAQGWKGRAGSALASAPQTAGLFRAALSDAGRRGRLQRLSLELDGEPIAMLANLIALPGAFSFKTAFDERFARFSPGVLLQLENLALLGQPEIAWCDSCAAADHPMIDSLWTERRAIGRFSVAIGGGLRRAAFDRLLSLELARNPTGIA